MESLLASGRKRFYEVEDGRLTAFGPAGVVPVPERPGVIDLALLKQRAGAVKKKNPGASLVDLGDGCGLVEFHSKMNALGADAIAMLQQSAKDARAHFDALVVGNQGEQFTVGANLMLVLLAVQEEEWDELDRMIRQFQNACMGLKLAEIPVVVAPFGLTLGGGTEISLHGARVRCAAETYMGLVEVGVGLVPAGGGTKEMALRAHDRCRGVEGADPFPFVKRAFDLIAFAKVSTSGAEALRMFLTPADSRSPNPDRLLADAKEIALGLARAGYRRAAAADRHPRAGPARAGHLQDGHPQRAPRRPHQRARRAGGDEGGGDPLRRRPRARGGQRAALPRPRARGLPVPAGHEEDPRPHPAHAEGRQAAAELN